MVYFWKILMITNLLHRFYAFFDAGQDAALVLASVIAELCVSVPRDRLINQSTLSAAWTGSSMSWTVIYPQLSQHKNLFNLLQKRRVHLHLSLKSCLPPV